MPLLSRRRFIRASAAGAAGLAANLSYGSPSAAQAEITFAFSLYGMKSLKLVDALDLCSRIGYDAVELAAMSDWPADPARLTTADRRTLRDVFGETRLALTSLMEDLPLDVDDAAQRQQLDRLKAAADLGRELSPEQPPLIETVVGGKPGEWTLVRDSFATRLEEWARLAERERTTIAVKPHRFGAMNAPEHAIWLIERVGSPWVRLVYDFSHFQHREFTLPQTLDALLPTAAFIHIKDAVVAADEVKFVLPGDGGVDYADYFTRLRSAAYRGCICVEVSGMVHRQPGYDPAEAARRSYANLTPKIERAKLSRAARPDRPAAD